MANNSNKGNGNFDWAVKCLITFCFTYVLPKIVDYTIRIKHEKSDYDHDIVEEVKKNFSTGRDWNA